jgi:hypothetical protein
MPPALIDVPMDLKFNSSMLFKDLQSAFRLRRSLSAAMQTSAELVIINATRDFPSGTTSYFGPNDAPNTARDPPPVDPWDGGLFQGRILGGEAFVRTEDDNSVVDSRGGRSGGGGSRSSRSLERDDMAAEDEDGEEGQELENEKHAQDDGTSQWYLLSLHGWQRDEDKSKRTSSSSLTAKRRRYKPKPLSVEELESIRQRRQYEASHYAGYYSSWYSAPTADGDVRHPLERPSRFSAPATAHGNALSLSSAVAAPSQGSTSMDVAARRLQAVPLDDNMRIILRVIVPAVRVNDTIGDGLAVIAAQRAMIAQLISNLNQTIRSGGLNAAFESFYETMAIATGLPLSTFEPSIDMRYVVAVIPQPRFAIPDPRNPLLNVDESVAISGSTVMTAVIIATTITFLIRMRYARGGRLPGDKKAWTKEGEEESAPKTDAEEEQEQADTFRDAVKLAEAEAAAIASMGLQSQSDKLNEYDEETVTLGRNRTTVRTARTLQARRSDLLRRHVTQQVRKLVHDPVVQRRLEKNRSRSRSRARESIPVAAFAPPPASGGSSLGHGPMQGDAEAEIFDGDGDDYGAAYSAPIAAPIPIDGAAAAAAAAAAGARVDSDNVAADLTRLPAAPLQPPSGGKRPLGSFHLSKMLGEQNLRSVPDDAELGAVAVDDGEDGFVSISANAAANAAAADDRRRAAQAGAADEDGSGISLDDEANAIFGGMLGRKAAAGTAVPFSSAAAPASAGGSYFGSDGPLAIIDPDDFLYAADETPSAAAAAIAAAAEGDTYAISKRERKRLERQLRSHGLAVPATTRASIATDVRASLDADSLMSYLHEQHLAALANRRLYGSGHRPQLDDETTTGADDEEQAGPEEEHESGLDGDDGFSGGAPEDDNGLGGGDSTDVDAAQQQPSAGQDGHAPAHGPPSAEEVMALIDRVTSIPAPPGEDVGLPRAVPRSRLPPLATAGDGLEPELEDDAHAGATVHKLYRGASADDADDLGDGPARLMGAEGASAFSKRGTSPRRSRVPRGSSDSDDEQADGDDAAAAQEHLLEVSGNSAPQVDVASQPRATRLDLMPPSAEDLLDRVRRVYDMERARVVADQPLHMPSASVTNFRPNPAGIGSVVGRPVPPSGPIPLPGGARRQAVRRIDAKLYSSPYLDALGGAGGGSGPSSVPRGRSPGGPPTSVPGGAQRRSSVGRRGSAVKVPGGGSRSESPVNGAIAWPQPDLRGGVPTVSAQGRRDDFLAAIASAAPPGTSPSLIRSPLQLGRRPSIGQAVLPSPGGAPVSAAARYGAAPVPGSVSRGGGLPPASRAGFPVSPVSGDPYFSPPGLRRPVPAAATPTVRGSGVVLDTASTSELVQPSPDSSPA